MERGSGIAHSGGMWRWPRTESPLSGSYEGLSALLSLSVLARTCSKKSTGRGRIRKSCIKNECGDRNMHLGTWLSMIGFPCKLWVRNYWDLPSLGFAWPMVVMDQGCDLCRVKEFSVVSSCQWPLESLIGFCT